MKRFDEIAFVVALTEREHEAQEMKKLFNPDWLVEKSYVPVVKAIFDFIEKHKCAPSFSSLHEFMKDVDQEKYDARYRATLTNLAAVPVDRSKQTLAISKAKESAAAISLTTLISGPTFQEYLADGEGDRLRSEIARWLQMHTERGAEQIIDIRKGFDMLIDSIGSGKPGKIKTGVKCIDEWTNGGIRAGQLGILMAPTGNGKSAVLMNMAHYIATAEEKSVLFLTNELTILEQLERFLVRMQTPDVIDGKEIFYPLQQVQDDPSLAYRGLQRRWQFGLEKRLLVGSLGLNDTCDDIEERLHLIKAQDGFKPTVLVIDFMERMAPAGDSSVKRGDKEYLYFGEIAKELIRLSKRLECAVWTAIQTNRGGMNSEAGLSLEHAQGSTRHLQEASCIIGLRKETITMDAEGNDKVKCLTFKELKQRHSAMEDREVRLRVELDHMYITGEEIEVPEDAPPPEVDDNQNVIEPKDSGKLDFSHKKEPWKPKKRRKK